jgi:hypothetical protein
MTDSIQEGLDIYTQKWDSKVSKGVKIPGGIYYPDISNGGSVVGIYSIPIHPQNLPPYANSQKE